ncbi:cytochrome P450 52A12 [Lophiostoma macrostomum CBS 122681]|uniref:Cytochrome P450 52A12 n=1 Tax=Lophiostoma macrostomum CBS 122681 TaxID=1314788 RepID=A0A6A6TEW9_9PLEO|nr:cytochrome P450 52A12 [Lophiostoma macrostomum CBS 122681]
MQSYILYPLCFLAAFLLYNVATFITSELRHRKNARLNNCEKATPLKSNDPLGIRIIVDMLKADKERRLVMYFEDLMEAAAKREKFRHSTYESRLLNLSWKLTIEPENVKTVLATKFKDFVLGDLRRGNFSPLLGNGIFTNDDKQWEHSRALLRPQFVREQVSDLELEERHVQNLLRALPLNNDGWTNVTDLQKLFFRLTIDSASEFLFGKSIESQLVELPDYAPSGEEMKLSGQTFANSFDRAQRVIANSSTLGGLYWLGHTREFKKDCKVCHDFIDQYVHEALARPTTGKSEAEKQKYVFLEALLESTRDPIELRGELLNIMLAGRDTTASLLSFVFVYLEQHPKVFAKLRATIIEDFGTYSDPRNITFTSLKNCAYLQWCMNETLRLQPVVPIDARTAVRDTVIPTGGGPDGRSPIYIRAGEEVNWSVYVMHRRKDIWGPDADSFNPSRWNGRKVGWEYLPFNGGPRICIGQQFALTEAGYVIVRLLQRFEGLSGVGNTWEPVEKGGFGFVRQALSLTMAPADGVKVRLKEARE